MITLKSAREIEAMKASGAIIAGMHIGLRDIIKPGISTWEIEEFGRKYIEDHGGRAAQIGFEGFEYATTVSVNNEVAHAFPRKGLFLKDGDLVKVDTVVDLDGAYSDSAWTYAVGEISAEHQRLMDVAFKALYLGIDQAQVGNRLGDIGAVINAYVEDENGFGNVREYIGHGIGPTMHEDPAVPHYGVAGRGLRLKPGMTITIEPMVNVGDWRTETSEEDGWTVTTKDGSWSAQFEHTIAITNDGPKILTSQDPIFDAKYL
ncbi:methionine aminopeptidase [Weissella oryzae SG25]|uniref:Methionine aminopeptidase n=1 Tax=Weissella oryzae (strain DSM 25784 / JCM 18191 / LMG 30913 / SG25) TaxID=1329250 RepID=A0A069CTA1_WEIOS|nr:type I methionyl aminopeptidase [Weissella oryzae]GAK30473.1 methionine aminopeptidase [Weissella oryzae SG25]